MRGKLRLAVALGTVMAVMSLTAVASAAPEKACPTNWEHITVEDAAAEIHENLLDPSPFPSVDDLAAAIAGIADQNDGDGWVCMKTFWGDHLNPKSHWYKVGMELTGSATISYLTEPDNPNVNPPLPG